MTDWIECNLPWSFTDYSSAPSAPQYPNYDDKVRELFGKTENEFKKETLGDYEYIMDSPVWKAYSVVEEEISRDIRNLVFSSYQEELAEKQRRFEMSDDSSVKAILAYRKHKRLIDEWYNSQPEVEAISAAYSAAHKAWRDNEKQKSFSGRQLNVPGTLIQVQVGDKIENHLIGTINASSGVCDDCTAFSSDAVVLRYKMVYSLE